jgi:hypothetical protein
VSDSSRDPKPVPGDAFVFAESLGLASRHVTRRALLVAINELSREPALLSEFDFLAFAMAVASVAGPERALEASRSMDRTRLEDQLANELAEKLLEEKLCDQPEVARRIAEQSFSNLFPNLFTEASDDEWY